MGGTDALRRSLGLTGYTSGTSRKGLSSSAVKALQQADKILPSNLENIHFEDLPGIADSARRSGEQVETTLTTIDDQPIDTTWVTLVRRELVGLKKAMTEVEKQPGEAGEYGRPKIRGRKTSRPGASKTDGNRRH